MVWAAVLNSQGGIDGEAVSPEQAFPSLAEITGGVDGTEALIADLKGRGARDLRGNGHGGT